MECNFTYKHYNEAINLAKKLGFSFYTMHEFLAKKPKDKFIVMRHDVDLSLKHALVMAEAEKLLGIKSTYFIRVGGIYNPFYLKNLEIMRSISRLGHEIGIHYDIGNIGLKDIKTYLLNQKNNLELLLKKKIFGAALHRTKNIKDLSGSKRLNIAEDFLPFAGLEYDAYSSIFVDKMAFISDSRYHWKKGCMCTHITKDAKLYILTHPIWWSRATESLVSLIEELL